MNALAGLNTNDENIQQETDSVGGGGPMESGIYPSVITMAYVQKSKNGATGINLHYKTEAGREQRQVLWVASGDAKGNKTYYEDKQGNKKFLPGFNIANSLCLLTLGKEISEVDTEEKVVKVYSPEAQGEVPTQVEVITDLIGQEAYLAVQKQTVDKNVKTDNGSYVPSGDTRDVNEIDKVFRASDKMTTTEIRAEATEPAFFNTWKEKFEGQVINKAKGTAGGAQSGAPQRAPLNSGAPAANQSNGGGAAAPKQSLFG